ncbi:hypothetical protein GF351_05560 [Candidatus Woesearchaeota archaeon]|nr:hypothetical protein [Candidatus Woesearchaeota archaeon]
MKNSSKIKKSDLLLLHHLRKNARTTITDVHKSTKISMSCLFDRLDILEQETILGYTSLVDFSRLRWPIRIFFIAKTKSAVPHCRSINSITRAENCLIVEGIFRNMKELDEYRERLRETGIEEVEEHHVLEELKVESFLTDEKHLNMIPI